MKTGMSIDDLAAEIVRQNKAKQDFIVESGLMQVKSYENGLMLHIEDNGMDLIEPLELGPIAHRQIGTSLGIPGRYYDRMKYSCPELLATNCNTWFQKEPENRTLRCLDGVARAFLSDRYRPIDNLEIMSAAIPILGELPSIRFVSCEMTENRMYVKIVCPTLQEQVGENTHMVQAGIIISNSETGQGAVYVKPLIYVPDWDCGIIVDDDQIRRDHRGPIQVPSEKFYACPSAQFSNENLSFLEVVQQALKNAVDESVFHNTIQIMRTAASLSAQTENMEALVKCASDTYKILKDERIGVLRHFSGLNRKTLLGLAGAVSQQSTEVEDYDRATQLEAISYQILSMTADDWNRLNHAAAT